jgi:hypothetical protein
MSQRNGLSCVVRLFEWLETFTNISKAFEDVAAVVVAATGRLLSVTVIAEVREERWVRSESRWGGSGTIIHSVDRKQVIANNN